ncbi:hypothetical protein CAP31_00720 [Sulfuriferula sp. AH1]|uniref:hypothetical protein n=1 Tax=Sulfuriferula sp. AH1 TaxID=1985873 RepID=UPI000B3B1DC6|nr:hypothetical protein [Sulfuriferula sp. AH1]ARU30342.1 hypothetical protein CAP31_00720 [Sulfuriferula sp. AH1]
MSSARYTAEFKAEAVKQVTERGHGVVVDGGLRLSAGKPCAASHEVSVGNRIMAGSFQVRG